MVLAPSKMTCTLVCFFNSDEFLTEAKKIGNRDEDIFPDFQVSIWIYNRKCWFLFKFFDNSILFVVFKKTSVEVVHFF